MAAALYATNIPISKILLNQVSPTMMAAFLYLGAASCWGLENNCTRMLSSKCSVQITTIKGIFSGLGSLIVALVVGEPFPAFGMLLLQERPGVQFYVGLVIMIVATVLMIEE